MTGRDLIIYILENNLENEPVITDDKMLGFMSVSEAALKFEVGVSTINLWIRLGYIPHICIGGVWLIPGNTKKPNTTIDCEVLVV